LPNCTGDCEAGKQEGFYTAELLCEEAVTSRKDFILQNCSVKKRLQAGNILYCRTALLRSGYKQERFYTAELLC
jgi:hypothetical protein